MRTSRTSLGTVLSLAACALLLAGCGMTGGGSGDGGENEAPVSERSREPVNGGKVEPGQNEPREVLASQDVTSAGTDLQVAVHELTRRGEIVELTFSLTNTDDSDDWAFNSRFSGVQIQHDDADSIAAVELIDPINGKIHLVARDSDGNCVCSRATWHDKLHPGDSVLLSATFGAPPEDVSTMTVRMPLTGSLNDVPLS